MAKKKSNTSPLPADDDVNKIREIIFGSQMQEYAQRFERMEARFAEEMTKLLDAAEKRHGSLQKSMTEMLEHLEKRLESERQSQEEDREAVRGELARLEHDLVKRLKESDDSFTSEIRTLRELLDARHQTLESAGDTLREMVSAELERLEAEKVDAGSLAKLFTDISARLARSGRD